MSRILDLFGHDTTSTKQPDWKDVVAAQNCPFVAKRCYKVRKSQPEISIGTCTVEYGNEPIIICPLRLLQRRQIFTDCVHLLTGHEPGNELHIVSEVNVPGGSIDYILASVRGGKVRDFVGIELQTLDTTGTVWPERQRFLASKRIEVSDADVSNSKSYGMNWKMTAKTILVQLLHKISTFEAVNKHLVLVVQDRLLQYMAREFSFSHLSEPPRVADPMHFHAYSMTASPAGHRLSLARRLSTDTAGIAACMALQADAKLELDVILAMMEKKLTGRTRFDLQQAPPPIRVDPEA